MPVLTTLILTEPIRKTQIRRRNFKDLNSKLVETGADKIRLDLQERNLSSETEIDQFCNELILRIQNQITETVPYRKPAAFAKPWWNKNISDPIHNERQLKREWRNARTQQSWDDLTAAIKTKKKLIFTAKRAHWRSTVHEAASSGKGIWGIAKWARQKCHIPPEPAQMPNLQWNGRWHGTSIKKAQALCARFYPVTNADLEDIDTQVFVHSNNATEQRLEITWHTTVTTVEEIRNILNCSHPDKCPVSDEIPNRFLKTMGEPFILMLVKLINACLQRHTSPHGSAMSGPSFTENVVKPSTPVPDHGDP